MGNTEETIKKLVFLYYGQEDDYYISLALDEIRSGLTIDDVKELMEQAEL